MARKGKRVTIRENLMPYIQQVQQQFALETESDAINLIIGWCSNQPFLPINGHSWSPEATSDHKVQNSKPSKVEQSGRQRPAVTSSDHKEHDSADAIAALESIASSLNS